eukprot:TRINITY_DN729_c2_g1_i3.p1 TRINITY_DN729_c2_g1~~TRINITY_DN729_c2_g1_i3.p1  ORF type:complete len:333 (+),score=153.00 TRINITY_DN729_c2_g1_i3:61-999(+)
MSDGGWCTIESDPHVFTEMLEKIGVKNTEVQEIESLDGISDMAQDCYGLIFLFKWKPAKRDVEVVQSDEVYFAKQIVSNACATQALINILLNCRDRVDIGETLSGFYEFTKGMPAEARGECMGTQEVLRREHNSFKRSECFSFEREDKSGDGDAYHFIAYLPKGGALFELDGLLSGPVLLGDAGENWLESAVPKVQQRIQEVQALDTKGNGLMFNLLAVTSSRIARLQREVSEGGPDVAAKQARLADLQEQREAGRKENVRRRHNYIPLAIELLKALAEKDALEPLIAPALKKSEERIKERERKKKERKEKQ